VKNLFALFALPVQYYVACSAAAQVALSPGSGPVPSLIQPGQKGAIVSAERVSLYKEALPAEILALVNERRLVLEVGKVDEGLFQTASYSSNENLKLDPAGFGESTYFEGLHSPFPAPQVTDAQRDIQRVGLGLLWNAASVFARHGYFDASLKLSIYTQRGTAPREVSLAVQRWYPKSFGMSPGKISPLLREKISFTQPDILKGLQALTLRFFGQEEDAVWFSSPTTETVRRVTGSNRADDFFAHALSPDDLFGESNKVEGQRVIAVQRSVLLVPILKTEKGKVFPTASPHKQASDPFQCTELFDSAAALKIQRDSRSVTENGSGASPLYQNSPPWNPSNVIWTPRNVWRVETVSRDPFSKVVRTITHIDEGSMTPVLRSTWNEKGEGIRTTIQIFLGGSSTISAQLLFDGKGEGASVLTTESFKSCSGGGSEKGKEFLSSFDPVSLVSAKATGKKVETPKEVVREVTRSKAVVAESSEEAPQD